MVTRLLRLSSFRSRLLLGVDLANALIGIALTLPCPVVARIVVRVLMAQHSDLISRLFGPYKTSGIRLNVQVWVRQARIGVLMINAGTWYGPNTLRRCRLMLNVLPWIDRLCNLQNRDVLQAAGSVEAKLLVMARVTAFMPIGLN